MTQNINQLKEEISSKDSQKQDEDTKKTTMANENTKLEGKKTQYTQNITSSDEMIKT